MTYTSLRQFGAVHVQCIKPIDKRIVRFQVSVRVAGYNKEYFGSILSLYTKLALSGTTKKGKEAIDSYLKKNGVLLSISRGDGFIHYSCSSSKDNIQKAVKLLTEIIFEIKTPKKEFDHAKALLLEINREAHDDARRMANTQFRNILFKKNSPYFRETLTKEKRGIKKTTMTSFRNFVKTLRRSEWYVSVVGDAEVLKTLTVFTNKLQKEARSVQESNEPTGLEKSKKTFVTIPGKANVELYIGSTLLPQNSQGQLVPLLFGLNVLGKPGGFSGRLMSTVREKEGFTYSIYTQTESRDVTMTGLWYIGTFFTAKDLARGIGSTMRELKKIVRSGITKRELLVFKEMEENQLIFAHESNKNRLLLYHNSLLRGQDENTLLKNKARVQKLTVQEVNAALKKYIDPTILVYSGAGPVDSKGRGIVR